MEKLCRKIKALFPYPKKRSFILLFIFYYIFFSLENYLYSYDVLPPIDRGQVSEKGYLNLTYKIKLNLTDSRWMHRFDLKELLKVRGKVAEFWHSDYNTRIVLAIEEHPKDLIETAENNLTNIQLAFQKTWIIARYNWIKKGKNLCYYQSVKVKTDFGDFFVIQNYVILKNDNPRVKISFYWISPLDNYYSNRVFLNNIFFKSFFVN